MIYLTPSAEKENFRLESGIEILGVVFVRLKKNMQHILRQYHFYFTINQGIKRINAGEKI